MKDLAEFWEDISRTFPGARMTSLVTETFGCGHYTPVIKTGDESTMALAPIDLGPLPRPRSEIEEVRAYSLARHLLTDLEATEVVDIMEVIKLHEPDEFIQAVRSAYKNLSTINR